MVKLCNFIGSQHLNLMMVKVCIPNAKHLQVLG